MAKTACSVRQGPVVQSSVPLFQNCDHTWGWVSGSLCLSKAHMVRDRKSKSASPVSFSWDPLPPGTAVSAEKE